MSPACLLQHRQAIYDSHHVIVHRDQIRQGDSVTMFHLVADIDLLLLQTRD